MTTLDTIDAVLDKLTIESAKELGNGYVVYARGMAYVIDAVRTALSSLPAQAVGVTDVMIDAAGRFRWGPDWSGKLDKEDWEDTRSLLLAALSAAPPSQPAAVGERADALWEQLLPLMQVEECPPGDPYKDKVAALALIEAALVHRDQVKL